MARQSNASPRSGLPARRGRWSPCPLRSASRLLGPQLDRAQLGSEGVPVLQPPSVQAVGVPAPDGVAFDPACPALPICPLQGEARTPAFARQPQPGLYQRLEVRDRGVDDHAAVERRPADLEGLVRADLVADPGLDRQPTEGRDRQRVVESREVAGLAAELGRGRSRRNGNEAWLADLDAEEPGLQPVARRGEQLGEGQPGDLLGLAGSEGRGYGGDGPGARQGQLGVEILRVTRPRRRSSSASRTPRSRASSRSSAFQCPPSAGGRAATAHRPQKSLSPRRSAAKETSVMPRPAFQKSRGT